MVVYIVRHYFVTPEAEDDSIIGVFLSREKALMRLSVEAALKTAALEDEYGEGFSDPDYTSDDEGWISRGFYSSSPYAPDHVWRWYLEKYDIEDV